MPQNETTHVPPDQGHIRAAVRETGSTIPHLFQGDGE
nr:MAG TPA: hypothetical protein [Caudoviricetes sp.]